MRGWRSAAGFSLGELMVALAVLSLALAAVFGVLRSGLGVYRWGAARIEAQQSARVALERMTAELRGAGYDPTGAGIAPIAVAAPALVTYQSDLNGNGIVDPTRERVTFLLRPGESILRRDAGGGAQPIIEGARGLRFTYYDRAGAVTTDPDRVVSIRIELEVGTAGTAAVMEAQALLRNSRAR
ncbi:MAG TPA: prepilin-type N-terminal cleavage/methylation domain-containing protein [Candidatus Methylomirabilis sp.]|nr:prepilin-type N-terminal cleavage/methylation domain-containing protein [Candidatus Methylomirabilis sp.]